MVASVFTIKSATMSRTENKRLSLERSALKGSQTNAQRPLQTVPAVMFSDEIDVREFLMPPSSEIRMGWYSQGEYFGIKKRAMNIVRRMATTKLQDDDKVCTRGLEIIEDDAVKRRKQHIDSTVQRILEEQDIGDAGSEEIAQIYRDISTATVEKSIAVALNDAHDAEKYQKINSKNKSSLNKAIRNILSSSWWSRTKVFYPRRKASERSRGNDFKRVLSRSADS